MSRLWDKGAPLDERVLVVDDSRTMRLGLIRALNTLERWSEVSQRVRPPLGTVLTRDLVGNEWVPAPPEGESHVIQLAGNVGHWALYALMVVIPLTGWLMSSAKGFQTVWFGVLPLPDLLAKDKALGDQLAQLHWALNVGLLLLIAGHAAAALWHHFVHKDDTLRRML